MTDQTFGPQAAPQDYRIANRPGNPNWHGVKAWFDEAAKPKPYHERATVHIPRCPKCDAKDFSVTPEELADAEGVIACEYCETLISPDNIPWSTPSERGQWKQEAAAQIAPLAEAKHTEFRKHIDGLTPEQQAMLEAHNTEAAERRERLKPDYWDRRLDRAPLVSAAPHGIYK